MAIKKSAGTRKRAPSVKKKTPAAKAKRVDTRPSAPRVAAFRARKRAEGMCGRCGQRPPKTPGHLTCGECIIECADGVSGRREIIKIEKKAASKARGVKKRPAKKTA